MNSMYLMAGQLVNAFAERLPDRETGELRVVHRIQVMGGMPTRDGQAVRNELDTLTVPDSEPYRHAVGRHVRIPIGMFSPAKGTVIKFVPKGAQPEISDA